MTIKTAAIAGSILASVVSVSAALSGRKPRRAPGRTVTVTIEDPVAGFVRTVARSKDLACRARTRRTG